MNDCADCDRMDCRERGCIAPVTGKRKMNRYVNRSEEEQFLRTIIKELLAVMPVFPDGARVIIGLEDKYNHAVRMARMAVGQRVHD